MRLICLLLKMSQPTGNGASLCSGSSPAPLSWTFSGKVWRIDFYRYAHRIRFHSTMIHALGPLRRRSTSWSSSPSIGRDFYMVIASCMYLVLVDSKNDTFGLNFYHGVLECCRCHSRPFRTWALDSKSEGVDDSWWQSHGPLLYNGWLVSVVLPVFFALY